jgi:branched-chain amino acid transport system substrate-binding protein
MSKRWLSAGAFLMAAGMVAAACTGAASPATKGPIKLGFLFPFTKFAAEYGPDGKEAIELRLSQANYTVAGRQIQLITGDEDGLDPAPTLDRLKKLVEQDKVDFVIGPLYGSNQQAVGPYLAEQKIVDLAVHSCSLELKDTKVFVCWPGTDYSTAPPLGEYMYKETGYRNIVTVGPDYIYGHNLLDGATDVFKSLGGKVTQQQWIPLGTTDFLPYVSNVQAGDALLMWMPPSDTVSFLTQYKALGKKNPVVMIQGLFEPYMQQFGANILGNIGLEDYVWGIDTPANKKFVADFEAKYHKKPNPTHSNAYSVTDIALRALEADGGDTSLDKLRPAMLSLKFDGLFGPTRISPNGYVITSRVIIKAEQKDGLYVWTPIKTYPDVTDPNDK